MKSPAKSPAPTSETTLVALNGSRQPPSPLERLLLSDPSLRGAVVVSEQGEPRASAGGTSAEALSAIAILALRAVRDIGRAFELGSTKGFHATWGDHSLDVVRARGELLVCVGEANRDVPSSVKRLRKGWA